MNCTSKRNLENTHLNYRRMGWNEINGSKNTLLLGDNNFYARYTNGNRSNRGIKLCHWNAGSSHLPNKMNEIESVVSRHHPHIFGISEETFLNE